MRALIFDFDDTLIVSRHDRAARLLEAIVTFGHVPDHAKLSTAWGRPFREMLLHLCPTLEICFPQFLRHYINYLQSFPPTPCPGVAEAIPVLSQNARLFVHTASHSSLARADLDTLGLLRYFDFICGSDWQSEPKPAPGSVTSLISILREAGISNSAIVYVGDSITDMEIAKAALVDFVGVHFSKTTFSGSANELSVICDMRELISIVRSNGAARSSP